MEPPENHHVILRVPSLAITLYRAPRAAADPAGYAQVLDGSVEAARR